MNLIGMCILMGLHFVVLFAPRKWAVLGLMAGVMYLTQGQKVELLGGNLFAIRFLEVAGFARVILRREFSFSRLNRIDKIVLLFYSYMITVFLFRTSEGYAFMIGMTLDSLLCYFIFRGLIKGAEDFKWFLKFFLVLLIPYLALILIESFTGHNFFSFMGGILEGALIRNGRPRCWGSFRHPIILGTLGSSFLPLYIGLGFNMGYQKSALIGIGVCLGIVWASNSGGPLTATIFGIVGWLLWMLRKKMVLVRSGFVILIILLALFMKAPIWYLPSKVSIFSGGDGWHRSYLIEMAIKNLEKWWLFGIPITETKNWLPYFIPTYGGADMTNQYISYGVTAGLGAIGLFVFLLMRLFRSLGKALASVRSNLSKNNESEFLIWGLGVMLFVHIINWFGVSYFDQFYVIWFMQLAVISNVSMEFSQKQTIKNMKKTG